jgi:hypothetical protein
VCSHLQKVGQDGTQHLELLEERNPGKRVVARLKGHTSPHSDITRGKIELWGVRGSRDK